uniref:Lectin n=1 Tax=Coccinia grandis TaxID=387127 RepID=LECT_COCGR|nr:RecName: Full=Lectin; AltName: Full=Agglutinin; Short=CIA17 [Coccinia grandis]
LNQEKLSSTHFLLFPRAATLTWSDDTRYWSWNPVDFCGYQLEEAQLSRVSWFDCRWTVNTTDLKTNVWYNVFLKVQMGSGASGWNTPLNLELEMPNGSKQASQVVLNDRPRDVWFKLQMGNLMVSDSETCGALRMSLYNHQTNWKMGATLGPLALEA